MRARLREFFHGPLGNRIAWLGFAILFFQSGLAFTTWVLEPAAFAGGYEWIWVALFPVLLPAFFVVNRRLGCGTGACRAGRCEPGARTSGPWPMP